MIPSENPPPHSRHWLLLGVTALAIAGLYSIVLVTARTPGLSEIPLFQRLFSESLVVHVNLSVWVWFLSVAAMFWSMSADTQGTRRNVEKMALTSVILGTLFMSAAPLDPNGESLKSNYIPAISSPIFLASLFFLLFGFAAMAKLCLFFSAPSAPLSKPMRFGAKGAALIALLGFSAFLLSAYLMPSDIDGEPYYDLLFWGGGHILQFAHSLTQLLCWIVIAAALWEKQVLPDRVKMIVLSISPLAALFGLYPYVMGYDVTGMEFREFFTWHMIIFAGLAPALLAAWFLPLVLKRKKNALYSALASSLVLFVAGAVIGGMIEGQDVTIPAHYHGSIVSVTLAAMGAAYALLPRFGWKDVSTWKLAYWQPILYGIGQLMHISGLAWSGGYGVLRKTPGALEGGFTSAKAAMALMGTGGMLAIIGGLLFVVVVWKAVKHDKTDNGMTI